jgi:endonuclease III related protein
MLREYFDTLLRRYGPQRWWPGDSPFEVMVGAVLTQNTAWANVEKAIANLKREKLLNPRRLRDVDVRRLARAIRPSGCFNVKARRLKSFVRWYLDRFDPAMPFDVLRADLLEVNGIGPETADAILLYAMERPTFVVDAYTKRILTRHRLAAMDVDYDGMKRLVETALPGDVGLYNEFHALIVKVGQEHCAPTPRCETCPLKGHLPRAKQKPPGPRGPGGGEVDAGSMPRARARRRRASR